MGQAKGYLEEQENKKRRRDDYLVNSGKYNRCLECHEIFLPPTNDKERSVCDSCWKKKMAE